MKTFAAAVVLGAAMAEGFSPSPLCRSALAVRSNSVRRSPLALRMEDNVEIKPLVNPADFANEPTLFERQGFVEKGPPSPKIYNPVMGGGEGFGGLSRREAIAFGGTAGVGLIGVLWAVTRNPGYDRKESARDADKITLNNDVFKSAEAQAALALLSSSKSTLKGLYDGFKADNNLALSADVRKQFDVVKLRDAMNKLTFALDEDVQIKTDKIVRSIIQDIGELAQASVLKEGASRTSKRAAATEKWFTQTLSDLDRFLVYFAAK